MTRARLVIHAEYPYQNGHFDGGLVESTREDQVSSMKCVSPTVVGKRIQIPVADRYRTDIVHYTI